MQRLVSSSMSGRSVRGRLIGGLSFVEGDQLVKLPAKSVQRVRVKVKKANREELLSLRKKAIREGMKLLSVDEILEEVKRRRSGE